MTSIPAHALLTRRDDLLANELSDSETVMLDVTGGNYYGVKDVAKAVWDLLESPITFATLCERLGEQFDVDADTCRTETAAFLTTLQQRGLVVVEA